MVSQPVKQLELHTFSCFGTRQDVSHHIRMRWIIAFVDRLSGSPHIREDSLAEMPTQERVYRMLWVLEQASIQCLASEVIPTPKEEDGLVSILECMVMMRMDCVWWRETYIWVNRETIIVKHSM